MSRPFDYPPERFWQFSIGAVVSWSRKMQTDGKRQEIGHVVGLDQDAEKLPLIQVRWQDGRTETVTPHYLRTQRDL
ncbi:hypothetical protein [Seohaeicola zhoushanensis]|uniref:Uncharacterized protein n=1 Tax=Seohaeicola zhoushanensis TaxID=1569283 RepID=A0A8J3MAX7_9RHOB|nr:hypothetical protein [Seohaeicola zhoushanensis]GHF70954.1 hypothetical protein GCM10017056_47330 [Seohaeicola zhoushanensis]